MQFTFLDMAGNVLFIRDDAETALWTVEEYSLSLDFPYLSDKVISIGQRIFFTDPATGAHQIYEVKQAKTYQPDNYQQVAAEHICISELSDEHIDEKEITDTTCSSALSGVLSGSLWSVGKKLNNVSSANISRGSVWQAVLEIKSNWNVYIEPRVTLASDGTITRHLDILSTSGTWNGLRLSIDKNMLDPSVTYDDSEVYTALYGYGGTITSDDPTVKDKECNFADVVWTKTTDHPAKPKGQKYLEDPTATANFGRNGRARYGFYQNNDITDPNKLLEKTWETLKTVSTPAISVEGSVADLYRLGYADQPLQLHDIALVDVSPVGFTKQIQIIRLTVDLLDPTATTPTIGDYIPNIIYIERKTNQNATGSRGGGGGNTSDNNTWQEFRTTIEQINNGTTLRLQSVHNDIEETNEEVAVQIGRIDVAYDKITAEVEDRRTADTVLSGRITVEAGRITQEVNERVNDVDVLTGKITVEAGRITSEITNRKNADATLSSRIEQTDEAITAEVTRATEAEGTLSGRISVQADKISLVVTDDGTGGYNVNTAEIVAGINDQTGSYVKISADTINLTGYVTMTDLNTTNATIDNLVNGRTTASSIAATTLHATTFYLNNNRVTLHRVKDGDGNYISLWGI